MGWEKTVMSDEQILRIKHPELIDISGIVPFEHDIKIAQVQAEITGGIASETGMRKVVARIETHKFGNECDAVFYLAVKEWQAFKKSLGIEEMKE